MGRDRLARIDRRMFTGAYAQSQTPGTLSQASTDDGAAGAGGR